MVFKTLRSQKGFSLVELMVVVAIIGVLAVIGIPQYQKFMSKARQAEAKAHLNGIFQGEASFFTEYNAYTTSLTAIGAGAVGVGLRYNAGFSITACTNYPAAGVPPIGVATSNDLINTSPAGTTWYWAGATIADPTAAETSCDSTINAQLYVAMAWGNPTNAQQGATNNLDRFSINQLRVLTNTQIGL